MPQMIRNIIASLAFMGAVMTAPVAAEGSPAQIAGDIVYGADDAPVTVIEYASFTCPHCASFSSEVLPYLEEELISKGKMKLVFRNFVRDRLDMAVALAARCTNDAEKSKELTRQYFARQNEWMTAENPVIAISSIAYDAGLDLATLNQCLANTDLMNSLVEKMKEGHETYEITSVPTIVLNGVKFDSMSLEALKEKLTLAAGQ